MEHEPQPGDRIAVHTAQEKIEGVLMPRPEMLPGDFLIIKLDNGYNIGIRRTAVTSIDLLLKKAAPIPIIKERRPNPRLPTVAVLSTGGTISSRVDYTTGGVSAAYGSAELINLMPGIEKIANITTRSVMNVMSEDMTPAHWKALAYAVEKELKKPEIKGVVITHGTDTMHFTSAALSFFIRNLNKPVILTGSQRSIDRGSSDAFLNVYCAIAAAARWEGAEVVVCMHTGMHDTTCDLHRGTKVRKMHTSRRDAFKSINEYPLARVNQDGEIKALHDQYRKRNTDEPELRAAFEEKTALLHTYPGMRPEILHAIISQGHKGIVIGGTALGHVCSTGELSLLPALEEAQKKRIIVVIASQTLYGRTHPYVYTNLRKLSVGINCMFANDMLPEVAYIKLGWLLGQELSHDDIRQKMEENVAGEINERHQQDQFPD